MKTLSITALSVLLTTLAAHAANLTSAEIKNAIVGKTLTFSGAAGSGTTVYSLNGSASIMFNGKPDKGKWRTKGSSMCDTWTNIRKGKEGCYTIQSLGGNKYKTSKGFTVTAK